MASAKTVMLSLLPRRGPPSGSTPRCLISKRNHSILAAAKNGDFVRGHGTSYQRLVSFDHHQQGPALNATVHRRHSDPHPNGTIHSGGRCLSKYASVDHSSAYRSALSSPHGAQLELALDEGRGKDDAPFDPFSQFLDEMGTNAAGSIDDYQQHGTVDDGGDEYEEAEYETIEEYDEEEGGAGAAREDDEDREESETDEEEDAEEEEEGGPVYTTTGARHRPKSERAALRAGYPAGGQFAVVLLAGFQHKVTVDDLLVVNKLKPVSRWSVGSTHTLKDDDVLLVANQDKTLVGLPGVKGAEVDLMVEEITRDKTLVVFKKRRRKHSRRKNGFRRQVTFLRVLDVRMPEREEVAKGDDEGKGGKDDARLAA